MGTSDGMPLGWHRRHALVMAGQLPENTEDARLVLIALHELVDNFLAQSSFDAEESPRAANVLPFGSSR
jgi:hypothetical protein